MSSLDSHLLVAQSHIERAVTQYGMARDVARQASYSFNKADSEEARSRVLEARAQLGTVIEEELRAIYELGRREAST